MCSFSPLPPTWVTEVDRYFMDCRKSQVHPGLSFMCALRNFSKGLHLSALWFLEGWIHSSQERKDYLRNHHDSKSFRIRVSGIFFNSPFFKKQGIWVSRSLKEVADGGGVLSDPVGMPFCAWGRDWPRDLVKDLGWEPGWAGPPWECLPPFLYPTGIGLREASVRIYVFLLLFGGRVYA